MGLLDITRKVKKVLGLNPAPIYTSSVMIWVSALTKSGEREKVSDLFYTTMTIEHSDLRNMKIRFDDEADMLVFLDGRDALVEVWTLKGEKIATFALTGQRDVYSGQVVLLRKKATATCETPINPWVLA